MASVIKVQAGQDQLLSTFRFTEINDQARRSIQADEPAAEPTSTVPTTAADPTCAVAESDATATDEPRDEQRDDDRLARELESIRRATQSAVQQLSQANDARHAQLEDYVVELAIAIAQRIVRRELDQRPEIAVDLLRESLQLVKGAAQLRIFMHPDDLANLGPAVDDLVADYNRLGHAEVLADDSVGPGGCRVETQHGAVDQSLSVQLDRVREELAAGD